MILHSDQHNAAVNKHKMTPEDFVKTNRGIDGGKDLPKELLLDLFDKISKEEIKLDQEIPDQEDETGVSEKDPKKKQALYISESQKMMKRAQDAFVKKSMIKADDYTVATHSEHGRDMLQIVGDAILAAVSQTMVSTDVSFFFFLLFLYKAVCS